MVEWTTNIWYSQVNSGIYNSNISDLNLSNRRLSDCQPVIYLRIANKILTLMSLLKLGCLKPSIFSTKVLEKKSPSFRDQCFDVPVTANNFVVRCRVQAHGRTAPNAFYPNRPWRFETEACDRTLSGNSTLPIGKSGGGCPPSDPRRRRVPIRWAVMDYFRCMHFWDDLQLKFRYAPHSSILNDSPPMVFSILFSYQGFGCGCDP